MAALALGLRWRTLWASYWGDEAIAIGIALHPVGSLPHYLANDGSPPLYYLILHFWMELFGRSGPATHALSMVGGLLAIPAAWWSGEKLFGRRAARAAAALVATCAYLDYYSTETRMYSWLVLAAILAITCFVLAYRGAGRSYWVAATVLMAAVLYLHYYGLYLLAATVIAGSLAAVRSRSRERLRATIAYGLACLVAFAPWAPQFFYQLYNTGAPWAPHPSVLDLFGDSFNALASAAWAAILVAIGIALLSARRATAALRTRLGSVPGPSARPGPFGPGPVGPGPVGPGPVSAWRPFDAGPVHRHPRPHGRPRLVRRPARQLVEPALPGDRRGAGPDPVGGRVGPGAMGLRGPVRDGGSSGVHGRPGIGRPADHGRNVEKQRRLFARPPAPDTTAGRHRDLDPGHGHAGAGPRPGQRIPLRHSVRATEGPTGGRTGLIFPNA